MITCELIKTIPVTNRLGEGVTWHPSQKSVWWIDMYGKEFFRYWPEKDELEQWDTPERVGSFGFIEDREELIVAFESGFAYYNVFNGDIQWLAKPEANRVGNRFNDGKVDDSGRFWAGCIVERATVAGQKAGLYMIDGKHTVTQAIDGLHISNGLCWSPDGTVMYHADTPTHDIYCYDFDQQTGQVSNKQLFAQSERHCVPDGATVDAQGGMWSAHIGGGKVVRYQPDGEISFVLNLPVSQPTCPAFGGPDMDWLLITTAAEWLPPNERQRQPEAGNLLIYKTNVKGIAAPFFKPG